MQKSVNLEAIGPSLRLFHRRWSVPIVAFLHRSGPARYTDIAAALRGSSRDTLVETLSELQVAGVITKREEDGRYALTAAGTALGGATAKAAAAVQTNAVLLVALKKWPMPILVAVGRGAARFNEVKAQLPGITSGALAPALKALESADLVTRTVGEGYPPVAAYRLAPEGERIFPVMDELIRTCAVVEAALPEK